MCIIASISVHTIQAAHTSKITQTITAISHATTALLQEYAIVLDQEIKKLEDEYTSNKGFFDFIWEPEAQKTKRLQIAELRTEHQKIQDTIHVATSMPTKNSIEIYQNMLRTVSRNITPDENTPKSTKIAVLIRAIQSRIQALEKTI